MKSIYSKINESNNKNRIAIIEEILEYVKDMPVDDAFDTIMYYFNGNQLKKNT